MKIVFINDTFSIGRGVDTVIYELAKRLGKKHKVVVVTTNSEFKEKNFRIKKIKASKLFTGTWRDFLFPINALKFRKSLKKEIYDVANLHHATLFLGLIGLPNIIVTYHGSPPAYGNFIFKLGRNFINFLGKICLRFATKVITISHYLKNELIKFGVPKNKIIVIPNAVDEDFKPTWEDENYMLFVGRLEKHKRVNELIKLAKEINFPLKIVGVGPEKGNLIALAKKLNSPVKFLYKVNKKMLIQLYQKCSFFVSASKWEGFGLVFLEANACGKAIVGYNCTAIKERIINNVNGFKVKNYEELIKICKRLKENKNLRKKVGMNGYIQTKKYNWNDIGEKYEEVFKMSIS
ncbi:MAG: glycosyltransferase family 4 protein [Candidatus Aenigmatarchaeota archaeon]